MLASSSDDPVKTRSTKYNTDSYTLVDAPNDENEKLIDSIPNMITSAATFTIDEIGTSGEEIRETLQVLHIFAMSIEKLQTLTLTDEQKTQLNKLKKVVAKVQVKFFPVMRDRYGPVLRQNFFDLNVTGKTHGNKSSVVSLAGYAFYNNKAISTVRNSSESWLIPFRFKQLRLYPNRRIEGEYTYYDMKPISDATIAYWDYNTKQHIIVN